MDSSSRSAVAAVVTPSKAKSTHSGRSRLSGSQRCSENLDPNVSSPGLKSSIVKWRSSARNSDPRNPNPNQLGSGPLKKKIRHRKSVVAAKKSVCCVKCEKAIGQSKCLCVACESLKASEEEFFTNRCELDSEIHVDKPRVRDCGSEKRGNPNPRFVSDGNDSLSENNAEICETGLKRSWGRLQEEAGENIPVAGSGRVMYLVQEFEKLMRIPKSCDSEEKEVGRLDDGKKVIATALPGLQVHRKVSETEISSSSSSFCPSDLFPTSESLGLSSGRSCSSDSNSQGSNFSISARTSAGSQRIMQTSTESSGIVEGRRYWKRKQKRQIGISQKPFMLRTEQRGRSKEEEFMKKLQHMVEEEEKLRIPIAQGLPWTTEEPEFLAKPPVKENTKPVDLVLHTNTRAVERAEFDHQVAEKMNLLEQWRAEREKHQKLAEEEEIRKLRKELVPKAQPMPYFDRPFIPRRSSRQPTMPRELNAVGGMECSF